MTDGNISLVAFAVDQANNFGPIGLPTTTRIITVAGDYNNSGAAQLTIFRPANSSASATDGETYYVFGVGVVQADTTPGRDIPIQTDIDNDGKVDTAAYRFNSAQYAGYRTAQGPITQGYGLPGVDLPVSGDYSGDGTFNYASYRPFNSTWYINSDTSGLMTYTLGLAGVDIPVPGAYDGKGQTEIAMFRPVSTGSNDGDSFTVHTASNYNYVIPFSGVAGFTYKVGDIPAPADYDGVGRDEFAVYRPSTGQFFILNTPNVFQASTWTLRTVTMAFPKGIIDPADQPASEDYDGNGKADPTAYDPATGAFTILHSSTGAQQTVGFGVANLDIAAAGPLLYRLSALRGIYTTGDGYPITSGNTSYGPPSTGTKGGQGIEVSTGGNRGTGSPITPVVTTSTPIPGFATVVPLAPVAAATVAPAPSVADVTPSLPAVTIGAQTPTSTAHPKAAKKSLAKSPHLVVVHPKAEHAHPKAITHPVRVGRAAKANVTPTRASKAAR